MGKSFSKKTHEGGKMKNLKCVICLVVLISFVVLPLTAFSAPKAKDKIVVGMSRPLSGWMAQNRRLGVQTGLRDLGEGSECPGRDLRQGVQQETAHRTQDLRRQERRGHHDEAYGEIDPSGQGRLPLACLRHLLSLCPGPYRQQIQQNTHDGGRRPPPASGTCCPACPISLSP